MNFLTIVSVIIGTYLITKQNQKIMATFEQFQEQFSKQNEAIENIVGDIEEIKAQIANSGLTAEQEDVLFASLSGVTTKIEALAASNGAVVTEPEPEVPVVTEPVDESEIPTEGEELDFPTDEEETV